MAPARPPSPARGGSRRRQLLDIACAQFLANGYEGTSMDAIVAAAGGSKATLYRHFGHKQALFAACVGHLCDEFLARLQDIDIGQAPFADGLRAILMELVEVVGSPRHVEFYRLVVAGSRVPGVGEAWHTHGPRVWHRLIADLLERLRAAGRLPPACPVPLDMLAEMLFDMLLSHLIIETVILGRRIDRQRAQARVDAAVAATGRVLGVPD
ncbi:TetR/AcrR family transcriptional regulator [Luteimonas huabeiensis]|uniref:TetR/AcrR family transcriptional regulator n=1 Tax=Luteimonas huabeiensis TaxID=1244513 RepID=UPI0004650481|nr:TetR/AcrR family transcriptional regulator [Luteimonas huabeiensis]